MAWTLRSGRAMPCTPNTIAFGVDFDQSELYRTTGFNSREFSQEPLTTAERREIADAVCEAWNRWANPPIGELLPAMTKETK